MKIKKLSNKFKKIFKSDNELSVDLKDNDGNITFEFKNNDYDSVILKNKDDFLEENIISNSATFNVDEVANLFKKGNIEVQLKDKEGSLSSVAFSDNYKSFNAVSCEMARIISSVNKKGRLFFKIKKVVPQLKINELIHENENIIIKSTLDFKQKLDIDTANKLKSNYFIEFKHRKTGKFLNKKFSEKIVVSIDELFDIDDTDFYKLSLKFMSNLTIAKKRIGFEPQFQLFQAFLPGYNKLIKAHKNKNNNLDFKIYNSDLVCCVNDLRINESELHIKGDVTGLDANIENIDKVDIALKNREGSNYHVFNANNNGNSFDAKLNVLDVIEPCADSKYDFYIRVYSNNVYYQSEIYLSDFKDFSNGEDRFLDEFEQDEIIYCYNATLSKFSLSLWLTDRESLDNALRLTKSRHIFDVNFNKKMDKNLVFFESFFGKAYSGNPKYIYEKMLEMGLDKKYKFVWVYSGEDKDIIPGNPIIVDRFEPGDYYKYLGLAKYWVNNIMFPVYKKRSQGVYLQTWHGTPLKRLGFDITIEGPEVEARNNFYRESRNWNYLISSNPYSTGIFKRAFRFNKDVLEVGYPANDIFFKDNTEFIDNLKSKLDIPKDKKVILYAPTWRDDQQVASWEHYFNLDIDLNRLYEEVKDEYVILLKMHHLVSENLVIDDKFDGFVFDLSDYDDVQELYVLSDILITDYSSVFFDYAHLRKPMLFFTPDLTHYITKVRGLYLDMENELPGPVIFDNDELINCIKNIDDVNEQYSEKYDEFYQKFCSLCNGESAQKVIEEVFEL